jgi:hypothetical protein
VRPGASQPWQAVLELRQLDLQCTFTRMGVAGKDVQDKRRTVDDLDLGLFAKGALDLALLGGR